MTRFTADMDPADVVWEEPPPAAKTGPIAALFAVLKARPTEWARVWTGDADKARVVASSIRSRTYTISQQGGCLWEARYEATDGKGVVWARCMGEME